AGQERVQELEGQVAFLERQRVEVWASTTKGPGALGRAPSKSAGGVNGNSGGERLSSRSRMTPPHASARRSANGVTKSRDGHFEATGRREAASATEGEHHVGGHRTWRSAGVATVEEQWERSEWEERENRRTVEEKGRDSGTRLAVGGLVGKGSARQPSHEGASGEWRRTNRVDDDVVSRRSGEVCGDPQDVARRRAANGQPHWDKDEDRPAGWGKERRDMTSSWRADQSAWPPEYHADPVDPRTASPPDPRHNNAAAVEFSQQPGRQQREDVTTASARMSPTPADDRSPGGGDDDERVVEDDVRMAEEGDEAGGVVSSGNPRWGAPWERSNTPDALKHDNYDPMRYKTNAGRDRWAADTARTSAGAAAAATPSAAVPNAGDWNGAASYNGPRVNWAQDYLEPSERRSMPSGGQQPPPPSSFLHDGSQATAAAAEEGQGGVASRPTGARTHHVVRVDNVDEKTPYSNRDSSHHSYSFNGGEQGPYSNDPEERPYPKDIGDPVRSQAGWKLTQSDGGISRRARGGDSQQRYSTSSLTNTPDSDDNDPRTLKSDYQARGAYPRPTGQEVDVAASGQR
ncbi:unnamed protein product, partial [Sphacelaria rigidula]